GFPLSLLVVRFSTADVIKDASVLVENPSTRWVKIQPGGVRAHPRLGRSAVPPWSSKKPPPRRFRRGLSVCGASERRFVGLGGCRTRRRAPRVRAGGAASAGLVHLRRGVPQRRADLIHRQLDDGA